MRKYAVNTYNEAHDLQLQKKVERTSLSLGVCAVRLYVYIGAGDDERTSLFCVQTQPKIKLSRALVATLRPSETHFSLLS